MTTVQETLRTALISHAPLAALIGARVYPVRYPQGGLLPSVAYQRVSATREQALTNQIGGTRTWFQITVFGADYPSVNGVAVRVIEALVAMDADVEIAGPIDDYDPDATLWRMDIDARVLIAEAVL